MNSQVDRCHHFPLSPPDLVTHIDKRNACFLPDPYDPSFLGIIYIIYLSVFFHQFPLHTNCLESSTKAVKSCFDFYFLCNIPNGGLYLKLKSRVHCLHLYQQEYIPAERIIVQVFRFTCYYDISLIFFNFHGNKRHGILVLTCF